VAAQAHRYPNLDSMEKKDKAQEQLKEVEKLLDDIGEIWEKLDGGNHRWWRALDAQSKRLAEDFAILETLDSNAKESSTWEACKLGWLSLKESAKEIAEAVSPFVRCSRGVIIYLNLNP
jgi:hypothetical protein